MLLQNLRARIGARLHGDKEAGFTLIELLVVMLILGILAAIALPAFFNQKEKAGDSKAKENAHTAQVAMETFATENGGSYEGATAAKLKEIEPTIVVATSKEGKTSEGIVTAETSKTGYKIESFSSNEHKFEIVNTKGAMTYPCTPPGEGGCPTGGWGNG
jgi:type IV pilus assembly protein PilA